MINLTDHLLPHAAAMDEYFVRGAQRASRHERGLAHRMFQSYRALHGFTGDQGPLLTPPSANAKLIKGVVPSYGLTLQHYVTRFPDQWQPTRNGGAVRARKALSVNACPHAGDCVKVCVLDNGNGGFDSVQRARKAKTQFLVEQPRAFAYLLGWELAKAAAKHKKILMRPNVNSDVRWDLLLPSMCNDSVIGTSVTLYGYTKDPFVLETNGWVTPSYRLAYSWNEKSVPAAVGAFLQRGGSVAMVTSRRRGEPIDAGRWINAGTWTGDHMDVSHHLCVDADKTDEWMFQEGVIGDLSAKGKARRLISKSGFVVTTGAAT